MNHFAKYKYMSIQKYIHEFHFKHKFPLKIDQLTDRQREQEGDRGFNNQSLVSSPLKTI